MKIIVFADSHGRMSAAWDAVERETPDAAIHLGDYTEDAHELARALDVWYVRGNNDFDPDVPFARVIAPGEVPIYLTHGHREHARGVSPGGVVREARRAGCAAALYGHTHRVFLDVVDGLLVLNPGSISLPRGGLPPTYAVLEADGGVLRRVAVRDSRGDTLQTADRPGHP